MKILLVRLRQIGDVVFTTPAIHAIRDRFPDAHLTYLVEPAAAPVVAGSPYLDEVTVIPQRGGVRGMLADLELGRSLRQRRFDLAIDFHGGPRASLLTWLSGAPIRIGYDVPARGWMYTRRVARARTLRPRHSVRNQWDLLESLDLPAPSPERYPVEMALDPSAAHRVDTELAARGVRDTDRLIVMHVSAGNPFRRWPLAAFAEVAAAMVLRVAARVVVTAGPSEAQAAEQVIADARNRLPELERERVLVPVQFGLPELRALVERADLYIGGDSGPMHIAATSRVPIVAIYGPTLATRSEPWRGRPALSTALEVANLDCRPCAQRVCAPGDFRCLGWIEPRQAIEAAERLLAADRVR